MEYLQTDDLKVGMKFWRAHPKIGVECLEVTSLPAMKGVDAGMFNTINHYEDHQSFESHHFIGDCGLNEKTNNWKRSFRTKKAAQNYVDINKDTPEFITHWNDHMSYIESFSDEWYSL